MAGQIYIENWTSVMIEALRYEVTSLEVFTAVIAQTVVL
jgi:hypothetical protein